MRNIKALFVTTILASSVAACGFTEEKEKPTIIYKNLPVQEASVDSENAITKRDANNIKVPSVSAQLKTGGEIETIKLPDSVASTSDSAVTVKRIPVQPVETETEEITISSRQYTTTPVQAKTVVTNTAPANINVNAKDYGEDSQPNGEAQVGQCYGKVRIAGTFKEVMDKVLVEPEKTRKKTIPAKYNFVDQDVIVREETVKYIEVPATYKIVTETVVVEPEKKKITTIPAKYRTVSERVMVKPATKVWKKGRGLIEKTGGDGEIMCLVEEPAKYETVQKKILVTPERQEINIIPAVTKVITKEVIDQPARVEKRIVPAIKKRIAKKVLVEAERTVDITIPAVYKNVQKKVPLTASKVVWRPVLCDYNITPNVVVKIQEALTLRGFDTGGVDGIFGGKTSEAVNRFQKSLGLESGGITIETLRALGVSY